MISTSKATARHIVPDSWPPGDRERPAQREEREDLLPRVAEGNAESMQAVIERYGPRVLAMASSLIGDKVRAEDAVQEAFIDLWKNAHRFDPSKGRESTYVTVVARRRLIDHLRSAALRPTVEATDELAPQLDRDLSLVDSRDSAERAACAVQQLKPAHRRIFVLWALKGLSHGQISHMTKVPLGTVKSHLRKSLKQLREVLGGPDGAYDFAG